MSLLIIISTMSGGSGSGTGNNRLLYNGQYLKYNGEYLTYSNS